MDNDSHHQVSKKAVCMAVHRTLLLAPIMGLENRLSRHCVKVMDMPPFSSLQEVQHDDDEDDGGGRDLFTWKPVNSIFVTLIKNSPSTTAIYVHSSDMHYNASEAASLGPGCPVNTVLLGQVFLDYDNENSYRVMILLFDALQIGEDDFVSSRTPAEERYRQLRQLCDNGGLAVITSPATMIVQWAGRYELVKDFSMGPNALQNLRSHSAESILWYGRQHPCKLSTVLLLH